MFGLLLTQLIIATPAILAGLLLGLTLHPVAGLVAFPFVLYVTWRLV